METLVTETQRWLHRPDRAFESQEKASHFYFLRILIIFLKHEWQERENLWNITLNIYLTNQPFKHMVKTISKTIKWWILANLRSRLNAPTRLLTPGEGLLPFPEPSRIRGPRTHAQTTLI